jgi:anti-sigma B factor antagonist
MLAVWVKTPPRLAVAEGGVVMSLGLCYGLYAGYAVAAVRGELDIMSSPDVASAIGSLAKRRRVVIVELSGLAFIDCGGLGVLLRVQRAARLGGGDVLLAAPAANVLRLLSLTGLDEVFSVHASADAAVASIAGSLVAVASPRSEPAAEAGSLAPALSGASG